VLLEDCTVWSNGCVDLSVDDTREHGLKNAVVDVQIITDSGAFPLPDVRVSATESNRTFRIPKRMRDRYGVPCGNGASVDVRIVGVIQNGE